MAVSSAHMHMGHFHKGSWGGCYLLLLIIIIIIVIVIVIIIIIIIIIIILILIITIEECYLHGHTCESMS